MLQALDAPRLYVSWCVLAIRLTNGTQAVAALLDCSTTSVADPSTSPCTF